LIYDPTTGLVIRLPLLLLSIVGHFILLGDSKCFGADLLATWFDLCTWLGRDADAADDALLAS